MTQAANHPRPFPHPMPFPRTSEYAHIGLNGNHAADNLVTPDQTLDYTGDKSGSTEVLGSKRRSWGRMAGAYALSLYSIASPTSMGPISPENAELVINGNLQVAQSIGTRARDSMGEFRQLPKAERQKRLSAQAAGWGNLAFGEAIAVGVQGAVQGQHASGSTSFAVGVGMAAAVDAVLSYPATRPFTEKRPKGDVAEAFFMAPWVGGGLAATNKKLPRSQYLWGVAGYTVYGSALAGLAEFHNLGEVAEQNPGVSIPAVVAVAGLRKVYEMYNYKTFSDRMAARTINTLEKTASTSRQALEGATNIVRKLTRKSQLETEQPKAPDIQKVA